MAKEETITFDEMFTKGLRPNSRAPRNAQVFTSLQNVRVRPEGLVAYDPVVQPISAATLTGGSVTPAFPTPQLFRGKGITLLADATKLFTVNESTWAITQVTTYDLYTPASTKAITSGGVWHFADFWNTFMLFNGSCCILKFGNDAKYYVQNTVVVKTGCAHKGRAIQGGFSTSTFWSSTWKTFWTSRILSDNPPNSSIIKTLTDIGPNFVFWSTIGGGDLRFLHDVTWATTGQYTVGHTSARPQVIDFVRRNEWGWMPMQFQGNVIHTRGLGQHLFVGGEDGIEVLTQHSSPAATFGSTMTMRPGLATRGAAGGNDNEMLFIDTDGCLWYLNSQLKLERLDYTEFFNPLIGDDIIISYDSQSQDYYICSPTVSYSMSRNGGISRIPQNLTGVDFVAGGPVGMFEAAADQSFLAVSEWFDLGIPGIKQLQQVIVTGAPDETLEVAIDYRYDRDSTAKRTSYTKINKQGVAAKLISGTEFRLVLRKQTTYTSVKIERVDITWKPTDARYTH